VLASFDILPVFNEQTAEPAVRAISFVAGIAQRLGANLYSAGRDPQFDNPFYDLSGHAPHVPDWKAWLAEPTAEGSRGRIVLVAATSGHSRKLERYDRSSAVLVELEEGQTEATLFAGSGLANLLGDPEREPLVPAAHYAAHTIGYAAFAALVAVACKMKRSRSGDVAVINGAAALAWLDWKDVVAASLGQTLKREGEQAEWPIQSCKDGHVAFLFTERDWGGVVKMIGDPSLEREEFQTFKGRNANRTGYMKPIADWCARHTKAELTDLFLGHGIPGAPVLTPADLLSDPLLAHRQSLEDRGGASVPVLPHRIVAQAEGAALIRGECSAQNLPLAGLRVLDLGIITAGAGVSALLADMGAEIIKVESETYPDPFRSWAGASAGDSPLFKSNNRNKYGVALDLKTDQGKSDFLELAKSADIVVENFRRGVMDRLGLTFDTLRSANPNILLASISGQGLDGPGAGHTTFGSTLEANSGFASLTCYDDGTPYISGRNLNYPDQIVCLYGAAIIALTAVDCRANGISRHLDISQRDCAIYQLGDVIADVSRGRMPQRPASAMYRSEAGYIAKGRHEFEVPVRAGRDIYHHEAFASAQIIDTSPDGAIVKGFPFQLVSTPMTIWGNSPTVGEHTQKYFK